MSTVFKNFKCNNFGDYHDIYLKLDSILHKDVFDNFRKSCYGNYKLEPVYFISAPHIANTASLKLTRRNLELLTDQDTYYELYERGIRGGISVIPHRYAIANNCYVYDKGIWNSKKHISFILYLDANNLYGCALSQPLSIGKFVNYNSIYFNIYFNSCFFFRVKILS